MLNRSFIIAITLLGLGFALTACDKPEDKAAASIERGDKYMENKDFDHARIEYMNAAKEVPNDPKTHYKLGEALEAKADFQHAFSEFNTAYQQDSNYEKAIEKVAQYYIIFKQYTESARFLDQLQKLNPENAQSYALRSMLFLRLKDLDKAKENADLALKYDSGNVTAYATLSHIHSYNGDIDKALSVINEGIAKNPEDLSLLLLKISCLDKIGTIEDIKTTFLHVFEIAPKQIAFRKELVRRLVERKRFDDAEQVLREGIKLYPENDQAKRLLVIFLDKHRSAETAIAEINDFKQAGLENHKAQFWTAEVYLANKQLEKAVSILEAVAADPVHKDMALSAKEILVQVYYDQSEIEKTKAMLADIFAQHPDNSEALLIRAAMESDAHDSKQAILTLQLLLRDSPQHRKALYLLASVALKEKRLDLAMDAANKLYKMDEDINALFLKADIYTIMGHVEDAIALYKTMMERDPTIKDIQNNYAFLLAEYKYDDPKALDLAIDLTKDFENSDNIHLLDTLAWVYYRRGEYEKALSLIEPIARRSSDSELYYHYGAILAAKGQKEDAKKVLEQALNVPEDSYPSYKDAQNLMTSLSK